MIVPDMKTITLDFEGTSKDTTTGRIVQVAIYDHSSGEMFKTLVDPEIPIPEDSTKIHRITDAMVQGEPTFSELVPRLEEILRSTSVIVTFNGNRYDLQLLQEELIRAGSNLSVLKIPSIDGFRLWQYIEPRTLNDASRKFLGQDIENAHDAENDVLALVEIHDAMRKKAALDDMTDLEVAALLKGHNLTPDGKFIWSDDGGRILMGWSKKYPGWATIDVAKKDPGFFEFILSKGGDWMNHGVRTVISRALENRLDEDKFNQWAIDKFGPPPIKEEEERTKPARSSSCPVCGGPTFHEPIFSGNPEFPDEVIDVEHICEMNGCDIYGFLYHQECF